jgi:dephospho-CoA kinase
MFVLGLTGSIGMGKSTVSDGFRCFGIAVFDSDGAVHALFSPGGAAVAAVDAAFPGCLDAAGGIDRAALGRRVFGDRAALARLEAIVHPLVRHAQRRFLARCCAAGQRLVVLDVPLLYETGGERLVDAVAVVSARTVVQAQRVLRRPGMSKERLAAILRRQLPDVEKRRRADFVIRTDLDLRRAKTQVAHVIDAARARPARAWPRRWPLTVTGKAGAASNEAYRRRWRGDDA